MTAFVTAGEEQAQRAGEGRADALPGTGREVKVLPLPIRNLAGQTKGRSAG